MKVFTLFCKLFRTKYQCAKRVFGIISIYKYEGMSEIRRIPGLERSKDGESADLFVFDHFTFCGQIDDLYGSTLLVMRPEQLIGVPCLPQRVCCSVSVGNIGIAVSVFYGVVFIKNGETIAVVARIALIQAIVACRK